MSPGDEAAARLRRIARDLGADLVALDARAAEIRAMLGTAEVPGAAAELAVALHHYYTAFESAIERSLRFLDGDTPAEADWHRALLSEAARPLPGIRPPLIAAASLPDLHELLRFRRFFRHAYAVALDWGRLQQNATRAVLAHAAARADLGDLRDRFNASIGELEGK